MRKLFFVRHGQTAQEYTDRCISQTDILLDQIRRELMGIWQHGVDVLPQSMSFRKIYEVNLA